MRTIESGTTQRCGLTRWNSRTRFTLLLLSNVSKCGFSSVFAVLRTCPSFRSSQLARLGRPMGTPQRIYEMVQGSLGRARHQIHCTGPTYTLAKRQPLPRFWATRSATLRFQRVLFGFCLRDVPRRRPRSFSTQNHALDKHIFIFPLPRLRMFPQMLSKTFHSVH